MKPSTFERIYPSLGEDYSKPGILLTLRVLLSVILLGVSYYVKFSDDIALAALIAAALISGYDIVINAVKDVLKRDFLHENLTVSVAVILSFTIGRYIEGIVALILLQLSYIARNYALFRTRKTICEVIEPDRKMLKGSYSDTDSKPEYTVGSILSIYEGISIPMDCVIIDGFGTADLSFITGSKQRIRLNKGDFLPAGSVCTEGQFKAEVVETHENALFRKMASLLKSGYGELTKTEKAWTNAASYFVPCVLIISIVLMFVLPLVYHLSITEALRRVITIIAIASPCGIIISVPLTYFSGIALARRMGILFTHANAVESSTAIKAVVFNKVGTLTERKYLVTDIITDKMDPSTFIKVAAYAAANSQHYLAKSIINAYGEEISKELVKDFVEYQDKGVSVSVDGIQILLGGAEFIEENGSAVPNTAFEGTILHMSVNGIYAGRIVLNEAIIQDASRAYLNELVEAGADRIAMVSGDRREKDRAVANELGIDEYYAECSIEEKAYHLGEIKGRIDSRSTLAFVGDCESGEKLFEFSDVGIMVNGITCHDELPKTDIVVMENGISSLPSIIGIARKTKRFAVGGMLFGCCIKAIIIALAATGFAPIWFGLLIDFAFSLAVLLNCTRICARNKTARE